MATQIERHEEISLPQTTHLLIFHSGSEGESTKKSDFKIMILHIQNKNEVHVRNALASGNIPDFARLVSR